MTRLAQASTRLAVRPAVSLSLLLGLAGACANTPAPGAAATPMGRWEEWLDLEPLVAVADDHVDEATQSALAQAAELLAEGRARSADRVLARAADGPGRHWISVARADLAALNFTVCIRGVAWRLPDDPELAVARRMDFAPETRIEPGDVSVEAMLTNLDAAASAGPDDAPLAIQTRIARARVTAFVANCAPNPEVESRANAILAADLATLAAQAHLTPDLAYLWAGIQMSTYSGSAARPFLLQAKEGGFTDPSVTYMLAIIALDAGEHEAADKLARECALAYAKLGDIGQQAQSESLRGEIARSTGARARAREHFDAALVLVPHHVPAIVGLTRVALEERDATAAVGALHAALPRLQGKGELDAGAAAAVAARLEELVIATDDDLPLADIVRQALLSDIDGELDPMRRGLRYFYAATLDVRLGDYDSAQGHAATAEMELEEVGVEAPIRPREFLDRLSGGA